MATVITVHGTYAHDWDERVAAAKQARAGRRQSDRAGEVDPAAAPVGAPPQHPAERQWWEGNSAFEHEMRELLSVPDGGTFDLRPFVWTGDNSERVRRAAGARLLEEMVRLEVAKEPYVVIGHSHGGSVVSAALLRAASRKQQLSGMKRWITVGTPFVQLEKEMWLFARLDLMRKVVFVASMMLFLMFLVYVAAEFIDGERMIFGATFPAVLAVTGLLMSLPAIVFYSVLKFQDMKSLLLYRSSVTRRARQWFGPRWTSFAHPEDEAIQGLAFLPDAQLSFFDRAFAVSTITKASVFALPLLYLFLLTSPTIMVGLADWLKTNVYDGRSEPTTEKALEELRKKLRDSRRAAGQRLVDIRGEGREPTFEERRAVWQEYRRLRAELEVKHPDLPVAERALRFRQRFFEENDKPCADGKLCGAGSDLRINSALLLHVATDELSWALGAEEAADRQGRWLWSLVIPAILVPLIFGLLALALMLAIRSVATVVSGLVARILNALTNSEVKRAAFGNDTEGEVAIGAIDRPTWLERSPPRLPPAIGDLVTAYSNGIASQSLAKLRRAIGEIASADPKRGANSAITHYFTWKELVHSSYFDVPEFRKLVAQALSRSGCFAPSGRFIADPDYARTAVWLNEIEGAPGTTHDVGEGAPSPSDKAAVSAVVAATVQTGEAAEKTAP